MTRVIIFIRLDGPCRQASIRRVLCKSPLDDEERPWPNWIASSVTFSSDGESASCRPDTASADESASLKLNRRRYRRSRVWIRAPLLRRARSVEVSRASLVSRSRPSRLALRARSRASSRRPPRAPDDSRARSRSADRRRPRGALVAAPSSPAPRARAARRSRVAALGAPRSPSRFARTR